MQKLTVKTSRPYDVYIGRGAMKFLEDHLEEQGFCGKILVVTDQTIFDLHFDALQRYLPVENVAVKIVPQSEAAKTFDNYLAVLQTLSDNNFTRGDVVLAFGGGAIGDLAAFAAATYLRGIRFFNVPTTLLSMCDASVGGKCGIDFLGKNDVGTFYQPEIVISDVSLLDTLPEIQFKSGMAEILKCAIISPIDFSLFDDEKKNVEELIFAALSFKAKIVQADEFDKAARHALNFGHTLGHAIEQASSFKILHGQAVAAGMSMITAMAAQNGLVHKDMPDIVDGLIEKIGLNPTSPYDFSELKKFVAKDKKNSGGVLKIVLAPRPHELMIVPVSLDSFLGGGKWATI